MTREGKPAAPDLELGAQRRATDPCYPIHHPGLGHKAALLGIQVTGAGGPRQPLQVPAADVTGMPWELTER